jgi:type II secretory ATPase GspE/PulE/Tfp pilus assembly ATPase PilB-like protein
MKMDVILELLDGRREEAALSHAFLPEKNEIKVILGRSGRLHTFFLNKLCCISIIPKNDITFADRVFNYEEVITLTGKHYRIAVLDNYKAQNGFFGLSTDIGVEHKLIFFPHTGIKVRREERPIGDMLKANGLITDFAIEKTLEEQKTLREKRLGEIISVENDINQKTIDKTIENAYKEGKVTARMKVGDILIEAGLVTKEQVENAITFQEVGKRKKIGALLIEKGLISEEQLLNVLAVKFFLRFINLDTIAPKKGVLDILPADIVHGLQIFPVEIDGNNLVVATSDPTDYTIPDSLRFYTKHKIDLVVATSKQISEAIFKHYPKVAYTVEEVLNGMTDDIAIEPEKEAPDIVESDSQIVSLVNRVLIDGFIKGASDIHFEPGYRDEPFQVRYRVDGICQVVHQIPKTYKNAIISRIKIISSLDISEHRKPQSGKILVWHENSKIEYRVEITPTIGGNEDAVLRILSTGEPMSLEKMDFSDTNLKGMKEILAQPYGIILCVGPTGSGKTTTLHSALKHLNTSDVKIWTVEDPVEITQNGLRQVQVQPKIGLTFAEALRSFLRADPDVIMIGEMRDQETAKTAIDASLTGHLVLSTLHTNSAPETVVRLIEMGIDSFNFADALLGVLAQRLARRLCEKCKEPYHPDKDEYERLVEIYGADLFRQHGGNPYTDDLLIMKKTGCSFCNSTGYKGRIGIHELLLNTSTVKGLIQHNAPMDELRSRAVAEGTKTLLMDGILKVFRGLTDLTEVLRVCRMEKKIDNIQDF